MKTYLSMLLSGAAAIMLNACSSDDVPAPAENNEIRFLCSYVADGRATDTEFETNDKIGVYLVEGGNALQIGGNRLNNEPFSYDGSAWTASRKVYWDEGTYDVYAYYPYTKTVNDTEDFTFEVAADQSTHEGYTASDFVWANKTGVAASESPVSLQFSHRMSKAIVKLEKGEDYEGEIPENCEVYIHSMVTKASVDLSTGDVSKDGSAGTSSVRAFKKSATEYEAIVVPQNIESRRPLVEVVAEGVSYLMDGRLSFKQGYSHTLVITLSKNPDQTKIEIGGSIGGWGE